MAKSFSAANASLVEAIAIAQGHPAPAEFVEAVKAAYEAEPGEDEGDK